MAKAGVSLSLGQQTVNWNLKGAENLIARCGETVLCTVPDLICILERDTATPMNTELLRYGFRVVVAGFPAPVPLTSAQALQVVGPHAFGYGMPYHPLALSPPEREG